MKPILIMSAALFCQPLWSQAVNPQQPISNPSTGIAFGSAICSVPDADFDGLTDLAIGDPTVNLGTGAVGRVFLHTGVTGNLIRTIEVPGSLAFGTVVEPLGGDYNGDGVDDLLVGDPDHWNGLVVGKYGRTTVISGADGSVLTQAEALVFSQSNAKGLAGLDDIDGDGRPDFVISADAHIYMPKGTGPQLTSVRWQVQTGNQVSQVQAYPDCDGDGLRDVLIIARGVFDSTVEIYSSATGAFIKSLATSSTGILQVQAIQSFRFQIRTVMDSRNWSLGTPRATPSNSF